MSTVIRSPECYPDYVDNALRRQGLGSLINLEPHHEACPGGWHMPGVLGGWHCPCPCHHPEP